MKTIPLSRKFLGNIFWYQNFSEIFLRRDSCAGRPGAHPYGGYSAGDATLTRVFYFDAATGLGEGSGPAVASKLEAWQARQRQLEAFHVTAQRTRGRVLSPALLRLAAVYCGYSLSYSFSNTVFNTEETKVNVVYLSILLT